MAKIDKSQYTKEEWKRIKEERRAAKRQKKFQESKASVDRNLTNNAAFVLGNGTSRKGVDPKQLQQHGKIYGCNALYREFNPDYLVAVDVKMILEINKSGYQHYNEVWTNPNKAYHNMKNFNFFHPSKGWSSGPTALWLAAQHGYDKIFILGFDYKGLEEGKRLNNLYADTPNYKKSQDGATFFGNWLRQTKNVVEQNPNITFFRVITTDNYVPDELNKFNNLKTIYVEDFQKMFNLS